MKISAASDRCVARARIAQHTRNDPAATAKSRYIAPSVSPGSFQKITWHRGHSRFILKCDRKIAPSRHTGHRQLSAHLIRADAESFATTVILLRGKLEASDFLARRSDAPVKPDLRTEQLHAQQIADSGGSLGVLRVVVVDSGERRESAPLGARVNDAPVSLEARLRVVNSTTFASAGVPLVSPVALRGRLEREALPEVMTLLESDHR